jgi:MscS family membrane protein
MLSCSFRIVDPDSLIHAIDPATSRPHLSVELIRLCTQPVRIFWRGVLKSQPHRSGHRVCHLLLLVLVFCSADSRARANPLQLPHPADAAAPQSAAPHVPAPTAPQIPGIPSTTAAAAPTPPPAPVDPLGRTTPHGCVLGFLRAAEAKDYDKAANYLDGERPPEKAQELAQQLKYLLDQGLSTSIDDLSRSPNGNVEDQLRLSRDSVGTVKTPGGDLNVMLDQVERPDQPTIWLFSQATLHLVPAAYASLHPTDYEHYFPAWTARVRFLSVPLWRWMAILISLAFVFITASIFTRVTIWLLTRNPGKRLSPRVEESILALKTPIFYLTLAIISRVAGGHAITALARNYWGIAGLVLGWVSAAWLVVRISDIFVNFVRDRYFQRSRVERATFVGLLGRLFKIFVGLVLIVALLTRAGVNVSALIAGLGIGGIALALAAQKTLADLFGGLAIIMRGAVRVGDFCQIDGITGTVEDIGISALSLRTLDRSIVSIPNSKVAEVGLQNFQLRDQFWLRQIFTLQFDTPHEIVKIVLDKFDEILRGHPDIDKSSARARLINLTLSGPQIEVFAYYRKPGDDWAAFLAQQEVLVLKMMGAIEEAGASLASPLGALRMETPDSPNFPRILR